MLANVPSFSWVGYVCHVEHQPNEIVLILIVRYVEVFREHVTLEVSNSFEVVLHVSRQYCSDHVSSNLLIRLAGEPREPVKFWTRSHQVKSSSDVMVLKHTDVIVAQSYLVSDLGEEDIIDSRMFVVVADCSDEVSHGLFVSHLALLNKALFPR